MPISAVQQIIESAESELQELDLIPEEPSLLKTRADFSKDVTFPTAEEGFRQAWQEAMTGQTRPISELWERLLPAKMSP
ncbi:MAG: hypothetical protein ACPGWR_05525 [Ardenticatenaceae bacterium]